MPWNRCFLKVVKSLKIHCTRNEVTNQIDWFLYGSNFGVYWVKGAVIGQTKTSLTASLAARSSCPEVFLKISQNSQENACARVSF